MKAIFLLTISLIFVSLVSSANGCNSEPVSTPTPAPVPEPYMPLPPESIPPEERAITYSLVAQEKLPELGMQLPRELTAEEKERVIQIALDTEPVSDLINEEYTYRPERIWMSYQASNRKIPWSYINNIDKVTLNPDFTFFPAAKIGLGTPQQYEIDVAVDLRTDKAVYAIRRPDKHFGAPSYVKPLTEEEKDRITTIALEAELVKRYIHGNYTTSYHWVAMSQGGTAFSLEYNIFERGIPVDRYKDIESLSMDIYPAVIFKSKDWLVSIAVDSQTEEIMDSYHHPLRTGP